MKCEDAEKVIDGLVSKRGELGELRIELGFQKINIPNETTFNAIAVRGVVSTCDQFREFYSIDDG